jgi:hypothetical protein
VDIYEEEGQLQSTPSLPPSLPPYLVSPFLGIGSMSTKSNNWTHMASVLRSRSATRPACRRRKEASSKGGGREEGGREEG